MVLVVGVVFVSVLVVVVCVASSLFILIFGSNGSGPIERTQIIGQFEFAAAHIVVSMPILVSEWALTC